MKYIPKSALEKGERALKGVSALSLVFFLNSSQHIYYQDPDMHIDAEAWSQRYDAMRSAESVLTRVSRNAYNPISLRDARAQFLVRLSTAVSTRVPDFTPRTYNVTNTHNFSYAVNDILKHAAPDDYNAITVEAFNGLLRSLDPHSVFYTQAQYQARSRSMQGVREEIVIIEPPAQQTPPNNGDDNSIIPDSFEELLRGTINVGINLLRNEEENGVTFRRERIVESPVTHARIDDNIGYVALGQFTAQADNFLSQAFNNMEQSNNPPQAYILDLRGNLGGYMQQAIDIVDNFVDEGVIVSSVNRHGNTTTFTANTGDIINGKPLTVLIDGSSASSSEIVAGALQHLNRATIIGTLSYGKGSVQSHFNYGHAGAMQLTTNLYYIGGVQPIQGYGVTPDIQVTFGQATLPAMRRETSLSGSLPNPVPMVVNASPIQCTQIGLPAIIPTALRHRDGTIDAALSCAVRHLRGESRYADLQPARINISSKELTP